MSFLRKTLAIQTIVFSNIFQYRYVMFFWVAMHLIGFIAVFYLWNAIFASTTTELPYTLSEIITYYVLAGLITQLTEGHFEYDINEDVRKGTLNNHILKPFSYVQLNVMRSIGWHSVQFIIASIVFAVIIFVMRDLFIISTNVWHLFSVAVMMILALMFFSTLSLLLGSLSFWITDAGPFFNIREVMINLLTGAIIPINFFPKTVQHLFSLLPFQYLVYTPINIYLGRLSAPEILQSMGILTVWICIVGGIAIAVWKKGLTKYEGVGL